MHSQLRERDEEAPGAVRTLGRADGARRAAAPRQVAACRDRGGHDQLQRVHRGAEAPAQRRQVALGLLRPDRQARGDLARPGRRLLPRHDCEPALPDWDRCALLSVRDRVSPRALPRAHGRLGRGLGQRGERDGRPAPVPPADAPRLLHAPGPAEAVPRVRRLQHPHEQAGPALLGQQLRREHPRRRVRAAGGDPPLRNGRLDPAPLRGVPEGPPHAPGDRGLPRPHRRAVERREGRGPAGWGRGR
mmetsp:Transcript_9460/g.23307  ORF Transcript_9460/g.23307 Transcript_9460/m.23307 type:complete len:246 (+) Transcript_9460:130-867(+)